MKSINSKLSGNSVHTKRPGAVDSGVFRLLTSPLIACLFLISVCACSDLAQLDFRSAIYTAATALTPREENSELRAIRKKYYSSWPKEIRRAVNDREVLVGMDKYQVQLALQIEEAIIQRQFVQSKDGPVEIWSVWKTPNGWAFTKVQPSRAFSIRFLNGKVVELRPQ
jgi:hypothetical protein